MCRRRSSRSTPAGHRRGSPTMPSGPGPAIGAAHRPRPRAIGAAHQPQQRAIGAVRQPQQRASAVAESDAMRHRCGSRTTAMGLRCCYLVDVPFTQLFPGGGAIHQALAPHLETEPRQKSSLTRKPSLTRHSRRDPAAGAGRKAAGLPAVQNARVVVRRLDDVNDLGGVVGDLEQLHVAEGDVALGNHRVLDPGQQT
jgi:hypothetical protein